MTMAERELKGGFTTQDPRLDRVPQFDVRNLNYPVTATVEVTRPRSYTWRCETFLDQGKEGACVGFSWAHELLARPVEAVGIDAIYAREKVYWEAQRQDDWEGGSYPAASPFYEGTSVIAAAQVLRNWGHFKEYRWAFNVDELALAVGYKGPAVIGINWYSDMFEPDVNGYLNVTGFVAGGHAILVKGVNVKQKRFLLHNSWGRGWGRSGCAYLSYDAMARLLDEQGDACIPVGRGRILSPKAVVDGHMERPSLARRLLRRD